MEFLEAIAEGMPPRAAAAIAQIPFETVRNWMSKNPKARKTSYSDVCKSARAEHRRNSGERSKATELKARRVPAASSWGGRGRAD
jgi:hypothetical protein